MQVRTALFRPLRLLAAGCGLAWALLRRDWLELRMTTLDERRVSLKSLRANTTCDPLTEQMLDGVSAQLEQRYRAAVAAFQAAERECARWQVRLFLARHGF